MKTGNKNVTNIFTEDDMKKQ